MFVFYAVSKTLDSYINKSWIYGQKSLILVDYSLLFGTLIYFLITWSEKIKLYTEHLFIFYFIKWFSFTF